MVLLVATATATPSAFYPSEDLHAWKALKLETFVKYVVVAIVFITMKFFSEKNLLLQKKFERETRTSKIKRERLSSELLKNITEFETLELHVARNYIHLIENQLAVVETHFKGSVGSDSDELRQVKDEIKKRLKMVKDAKSSLTSPL